MIFGSNLSYFNDLDEVWEVGSLVDRKRDAGIGSLRYPGGEETSRFHWEYPGVNGYVDLWNEAQHSQNWQSTWIPKDQWATNESFMDFDEFVARAREVGAEPLVGINMTSGYKLDRLEDSIAEAVRWVQYAKDRSYGITYWYLDNEPWHRHPDNYHYIAPLEYARLCAQFAEAMSAVDPEAKFIANPFVGDAAGDWDQLAPFMRIAGEHIDVIEFHWYWEFGTSSFERFLQSRPLRFSSRWNPYWDSRTYVEMITETRRLLDDHGYDYIEIGALEWNIGPSRTGPAPSEQQVALMQGEMFMQFVEGGLDMACVWPGFYQIRDVDHPTEARAWFEYDPPHRPRAPLAVVDLLSDAAGGTVLHGGGVDTETSHPTLAVVSEDRRTIHLYLLNKDREPRTATVHVPEGSSAGAVTTRGFSVQGDDPATVTGLDTVEVTVRLAPFSLSRLDISMSTEITR
ncbi:MAG: hypothetical protein AAGI30_00170 [Planctomycetota bacterium]